IVYSQDLDGPVLAKQELNRKLVARAHGDKSSGKKAAVAQAAAPTGGSPQPATSNTPSPAPLDPALTTPLEHYRLLLAEYQAELGKDTELPPTAAAIQNAKSKKDAPGVETAIPDLEDALVGQIDVPEVDLQALGKKRTRAIQDVLLADGGIDASRVFIINSDSKTD